MTKSEHQRSPHVVITIALFLNLMTLLIIGCSDDASSNATSLESLLPIDTQQEIINTFAGDGRLNENVRVEITGNGTLSQDELNQGYSTVVCFKIYWDIKMADGSRRSAINSSIALKAGDSWQWFQSASEFSWGSHSCPGGYSSQR